VVMLPHSFGWAGLSTGFLATHAPTRSHHHEVPLLQVHTALLNPHDRITSHCCRCTPRC